MKRSLLIVAAVAAPVHAFDLTKATSGTPEAIINGTTGLFQAERCIMMIDGPSAPTAYRTPDRPDESLIYYAAGAGHPIVYKLEKSTGGVRVTIYNGSKWRDKVAACAKAEV